MKDELKWYDERVEAYLDGDLPEGEARLFAARLEQDAELQAMIDQARQLQQALREMPLQACPPAVADRVFRATVDRPRRSRWMWAVAPAMAALLAVAVNLSGLLAPAPTDAPGGQELAQDVPDQPSLEELAQARRDLGIALAYLDRASSIAGRKVGAHLVTDGVALPLHRGIQRTHELSESQEDAS